MEVVPANPDERGAFVAVLERFGDQTTGSPGSVAVQLTSASDGLADIVRAIDREGLRVAHLHIHEPTLDDVFLAQTGRHLEGAGEEDEEEGAEPEPDPEPTPA